MLVGCLVRGKSIGGYIQKGIVEVESIQVRHKELVAEMVKRGYEHNSPLPSLGEYARLGKVDRSVSLQELLQRCSECYDRFNMRC